MALELSEGKGHTEQRERSRSDLFVRCGLGVGSGQAPQRLQHCDADAAAPGRHAPEGSRQRPALFSGASHAPIAGGQWPSPAFSQPPGSVMNPSFKMPARCAAAIVLMTCS